jgi:hypothetical protein
LCNAVGPRIIKAPTNTDIASLCLRILRKQSIEIYIIDVRETPREGEMTDSHEAAWLCSDHQTVIDLSYICAWDPIIVVPVSNAAFAFSV